MKKIICKLQRFVKSNIPKASVFIILCGLLTACGNTKTDPALEKYRSDMSSFSSTVSSLGQAINAIDPSSPTASAELLNDLDQMNTAFRNMAALTIPDEYSDVATLVYEASAYMNDAASLYHDAYGDNGYNDEYATQAQNQYQNAMQRVSSIGQYFKEH
ncbi:MAG: hypothetical protein K6B69_03395 [Lachnospiraceae bacterium]|nr:hypothetical protein [Lachnospiraceae bacterium]